MSSRFQFLSIALFVIWVVATIAVSSVSLASVPNWDGATCTEQFVGEFDSVWAVKVYPGPPAYVLMSGKVSRENS